MTINHKFRFFFFQIAIKCYKCYGADKHITTDCRYFDKKKNQEITCRFNVDQPMSCVKYASSKQ